MAFSSRRPRRWLPLLSLLTLAALTWWAWQQVPASRLIGHARVYGSVIVSGLTPGPCRVWSIHLSLDPRVKPPGPAWILHEGKQLGLGYELHWRPEQAALAIIRAPDQALLGAFTLTRLPQEIVFRRRGARLEVAVDGAAVITSLDALGVADANTPDDAPAWGCWTTGNMGDASITLFDDTPKVTSLFDDSYHVTAPGAAVAIGDERALATALHDPAGADRALLLVRRTLWLDPEQVGEVASAQALGAAMLSFNRPRVAAAAPNPDRDHLRHWLALAEARLALARQDRTAAEHARTAIEQLRLLTQMSPVPESAGMAAGLLPMLAARATAKPGFPQVPALVLRSRWDWTDLLGATADGADDPGFTPDQRLMQRLIVHAAGCLLGAGRNTDERWPAHPLPAPAEAPAWLLQRWRAFAGGNPDVTRFTDLPGARSDPFALTIEQLTSGAALEPVAAVAMRARIDAALAANRSDSANNLAARQALMNAPAREAVLARALLALAGRDDALSAHQQLTRMDEARSCWADRDPLALALENLLARRFEKVGDAIEDMLKEREREHAAESQVEVSGGDLMSPPPTRAVTHATIDTERTDALKKRQWPIKSSLAAFNSLMSDDPGALNYIWLYDNATLPPAQAIAVVLALQDVRGQQPDWSLLRLLPCFTLPLHLMVPPAAAGHDRGTSAADPGAATVPAPVP